MHLFIRMDICPTPFSAALGTIFTCHLLRRRPQHWLAFLLMRGNCRPTQTECIYALGAGFLEHPGGAANEGKSQIKRDASASEDARWILISAKRAKIPQAQCESPPRLLM